MNLPNHRLIGHFQASSVTGSKRLSFIRLAIVALVLTISAILPYRVSPRRAQLILVGVPAIAVGIAFLRWPPLGLAALIVAAFLVPFAIGTGTMTNINAALILMMVLTGLWLLDMVARERAIHLRRSALIPPALALMGSALIAFLAGQLGWYDTAAAPMATQLAGVAVFILSVAVFLLVAHQVCSLVWLQRLVWLFLLLGVAFVLSRVVPGFRLPFGWQFQRGAVDSVFRFWLVALAFSQAVLNRNLGRGWRLGLVGLTLGAFYVGFVLGRSWTSGWLPLVIAVAVIIAAIRPKWGIPVVLLLLVVLAVNRGQVIQGLVSLTSDQYSYSTRLEAWAILGQIVQVSPVLGLGPANYYWYTPLFPINGYYVFFNSHNQYVDLVAQTGLVGLTCYFWFFAAAAWSAWRLRERVSTGFGRAYVYGVIGGIAGTLAIGVLGDWVLPFVYNIKLEGMRGSLLGWLFLGGLVALEHMEIEAKAEVKTEVEAKAEVEAAAIGS